MRKMVAYPVVGAVVVGAAGVFVWICCRSVTMDEVLVAYAKQPRCTIVKTVYPLDGTLFPPEIVPPTVRWEDGNAAVSLWLVRVEVADGQAAIDCLSRERRWTPTAQEWERIKKGSRQTEARVLVLGVRSGLRAKVMSAGAVGVRTSGDEVGTPVFYREVNLPFIDAVTDPSKIRWRFGSISSAQPPPVVLTGLPVCGNCHSFTPDGRILAMDVDYANSKGSYVITPIKNRMVLATSEIITWDDCSSRSRGFCAFTTARPRSSTPCPARTIPPTCRVIQAGVRTASISFSPAPKRTISRIPRDRARSS